MNSDKIIGLVFIIAIYFIFLIGMASSVETIKMAELGYVQCKVNNSILWKKECNK